MLDHFGSSLFKLGFKSKSRSGWLYNILQLGVGAWCNGFDTAHFELQLEPELVCTSKKRIVFHLGQRLPLRVNEDKICEKSLLFLTHRHRWVVIPQNRHRFQKSKLCKKQEKTKRKALQKIF